MWEKHKAYLLPVASCRLSGRENQISNCKEQKYKSKIKYSKNRFRIKCGMTEVGLILCGGRFLHFAMLGIASVEMTRNGLLRSEWQKKGVQCTAYALVEVGQRNNNQWRNWYFFDYCGRNIFEIKLKNLFFETDMIFYWKSGSAAQLSRNVQSYMGKPG